MPNALINLGDLKELLTKYAQALQGHDAEGLDASGTNPIAVDPVRVDAVVQAMTQLAEDLEEVCQDGVLAVRLTPR
jgi:hypothetical protein